MNMNQETTRKTLELAHDRATTLGINELVVASTSGATAQKAIEIFSGFSLVAVTYHCGFKEPFKRSMRPGAREKLEHQGVKVVEATHALSGVERSLSKKYSGIYPVMIIADTLRLFGQGTKVAVEITIMAADAGMLSGKDIVSVGGTGSGADSALVVKPAHMSNFLDLKIREIICKPRDF
jgi:uncharacterized protein